MLGKMDTLRAPILLLSLTIASCAREQVKGSVVNPLDTSSVEERVFSESTNESQMVERQIQYSLSQIQILLETLKSAKNLDEKKDCFEALEMQLKNLIFFDKKKNYSDVTQLFVDLFQKRIEPFWSINSNGEIKYIDVQIILSKELIHRFGQSGVEEIFKQALLDPKYPWDTSEMVAFFQDQSDVLKDALNYRINYEREFIESNIVSGKNYSETDIKVFQAMLVMDRRAFYDTSSTLIEVLVKNGNLKELQEIIGGAHKLSLIKERIENALSNVQQEESEGNEK